MEAGKKAVELIKKLGIKRDDAAIALGTTRGAIDNWSSKPDRRPNLDNLLALRDLAAQSGIAITIDWFFDGNEPDYNPTVIRETRADYAISPTSALIRSTALLGMTLGTVATKMSTDCQESFSQIQTHLQIAVTELNMLARHPGLDSDGQKQIAQISNMLQQASA